MHRETPVQPKLDDLLARYLDRQADAHAAGTGPVTGEVTPYDAAAAPATDLQGAWDEAQVALRLYGEASTHAALPNWAELVAGQGAVVALPLAAGNFPQRVCDFQQLLQPALDREHGLTLAVPELIAWADDVAARRQFPQMLLAVGGLRLARQFAVAHDYVAQHGPHIPAAWHSGWDNENATLAWHAGDTERALQSWQRAEPTVPVLFNRGMAHLFLGQATAARAELQTAAERLAGYDAWQHLAQLYLALANEPSLAG